MSNAKGKTQRPILPFFFFFLFPFWFFLGGCGTPGDPVPPRPTMPEAIQDLAARQSGERILLTFTLPQKTEEGEPLGEPPQVEIFRGFAKSGSAAAREDLPASPVYVVPAAQVETYLVAGTAAGRVRFEDSLEPEQLGQHAGEQVVYMVRTRPATRGRASADSNLAAIRVYPVPEPIARLTLTVTEMAIELAWTPPERTTSGAATPPIASYRIYRTEEDTRATEKNRKDAEPAGVTQAPFYRDAEFEFDRTYVYTVRSVVQYGEDAVESEDSKPQRITPRDTFPPAAPQNLVAVALPAEAEAPAQVELSWSISPEPDVAGYHVYRGNQEGTTTERVNQELLLAPTFRDTSVVAGRRYFYAVTAVDRAGNQSERSAPVAAEIPLASGQGRTQP